MHALSLVIKSFTLALMIKSLTLAWKWASPRLTAGSSSDTCFGDGLHLVRLPGNLRTRAVVMILILLDFACASSQASESCCAVVMILTLSGFSDIFSIV